MNDDDENVDEDNMNTNNSSRASKRKNKDRNQNIRNTRQTLEVDIQFEPAFERNVTLDMGNIQAVKNEMAGVITRRPFNPNSNLIPLSTLISTGAHHGVNLVLIILSISSVIDNSQTKFQQNYKGNRGAVDSVRHDRKMVVMCPLSPPGSNTAMILFGAGCCERLFEGDISLRDNGQIRKLSIIFC